MDSYLANQDYKATWALQETVNSEKRPGMRGGHQLVIDSANCVMYLFGGWDGFEDLSDLWCYNIKRNSWTLIHERAEMYGGPSPRSCHKMVYDPCNSQIFTLGRYLDSTTRTQDYIKVRFLQNPFELISTISIFRSLTQFIPLIFPLNCTEWFLFVRHKSENMDVNLWWHQPRGWTEFGIWSSNVHWHR